MPISLISATGINTNQQIGTQRTKTIDTTGSNLIVAYCMRDASGPNSVMSDSQNNVWTTLAPCGATGGSFRSQIQYIYNPTTTSAHTITCNNSEFWAGAYSGANGTLDAYSTISNVSYTTLTQTGTPSTDNCLVIAGFNSSNNRGHTLQGMTTSYGNASGVYLSVGTTIQTTATPVSATMTLSPASGGGGCLAIFQATTTTAGGGGGTTIADLGEFMLFFIN